MARHFFKNVILIAGGAALGQGAVVLASPILTRLFTPSEYGAFGLFTSVVSILSVIVCLRYELAIPLPEEDQEALDLAWLSLFMTLGVSLLTTLIVWFARGYLVRYESFSLLVPSLWLVPVSLLIAGVFQVSHYWALRRKEFFRVSQAKLFQGVSFVGVQLSLGALHYGTPGLLLGDVAGRAASSFPVLKGLMPALLKAGASLSRLRRVVADYRRFPMVMTWSALLGACALQAPLLLITQVFGASAAGLYFLAYRTLVLPASLVGSAIGQVFFGEIASKAPAEIRGLTYRLCLFLFAFSIPVYSLVAMFGPDLFELVFGTSWRDAGAFARYLAFMVMFWAVASPLSSLLIVGNRLGQSLFFTAAELVLNCLAIGIGLRFQSIQVAVILLSIFGLCLCLLSIGRFLAIANLKLTDLIPGLINILLICIPVLVPLLLLKTGYHPVLAWLFGAVFSPLGYKALKRFIAEVRFD